MRLGWIGLLLALCLAGCAGVSAPNRDWAVSDTSMVWPESPLPARIKLLRIVKPDEWGGAAEKPGFFDWLTGKQSVNLPLLAPYGVVADGEGRVWIADPGSSVIHCLDLRRDRVDYWFQIGGVDLASPVGLALDSSRGRIYVADSELNRVFIVNYSGDSLGELLPPQGFQRPTGMAIDSSGRVFVADSVAGRIEIFSAAGQFERSVTSGLNETGTFNVPVAVAVDSRGQLLVDDSMSFRIELLDQQGRTIRGIGEIGDAPGTFARPRGVAVDSDDHVYVVDAAFGNVQIFTEAGELLLYFGKWGEGPGEFLLPAGLFIDQQDRIYVVDSYNHRLQIFQYLKKGD